MDDPIRQSVVRLFAQVTEALGKATWALLNADTTLGQEVVDHDELIDEEVRRVSDLLWEELESQAGTPRAIRPLVGMLLAIPELERSADLAEHIAKRAVTNVGVEMTPVSRGIVQRMSEVAVDMWRLTVNGYVEGSAQELELHETDEELDILHGRLTEEVAGGAMAPSVAAQVTLLARFYERIGDHAVNLSRRLARS